MTPYPRCCSAATLAAFFDGMKRRERPYYPELRAMTLTDAIRSHCDEFALLPAATEEEAKTLRLLERLAFNAEHHEFTWDDLAAAKPCGHAALDWYA